MPSEGARQSPRGESDPPEPTFGALGRALRLNWLVWKKRRRNTSSHLRISARRKPSAPRQALEHAGAEVVLLPHGPDAVDLPAVLQLLAERQVNEVLVETGATLSGSLLRAGLLDELIIYMAPLLMGDQARGLFHLPGLDTMAQRVELEIDEMRAVGRDWRISARPRRDGES